MLAATGLTPQLINPETPSDERGVAPAIYGLVVCSATLAAAAVSGQLSFVAVGVLVTGVVYWVAASHANVLARHAVRQMPLDWSEIRAILSQGWPMVSRGSLEKPGYGQFSEVFGPDPDTLNDDRIGRALDAFAPV